MFVESFPVVSVMYFSDFVRICRRVLLVVLWLLIGTRLPLRWRTSQYRRTFVPHLVSLWNHLGDPVFDGEGRRVLRLEPMLPVGLICSFFLTPTILSFSFFHALVVWGWGFRINRAFSLSPDDYILIIIIIIK